MGRFFLGAFAAILGTTLLAAPAGAAEITRVASRGEPGNPFDLQVTIRWDRLQRAAQITREVPDGATPGAIVDGDEIRWSRTTNAVVPRVSIALYKDLALHFEWPYVLGDDQEWRFGLVGGVPTGGIPPYSSIENNAIDAEGAACADQDPRAGVQCPLFPVAPKTTVYHGGKAGDLKAGVAWGVFNDRKDPTKPFWLVGLDVTFPTADLYDPAASRGTDWSSPHNVSGKSGAFGEKVWKWDLYTVLSRRLGPIDPYVKAHLTRMSKSSATYSNCEHAADLSTITASNPVRQMTRQAAIDCADPAWEKEASARLPWVAGLTLGTELVPWEDDAEQQKIAIDLRLGGDYTSSSRFYNELTDANGKLNWTEDHFTMGAFLGVYLKASRYVSLHATTSLSTTTPHFITGEPDPANPNFDARYDTPGRRFRISEVSLFQVAFGGVLTF